MKQTIKRDFIGIAAVLVLLAIDQLTKYLAKTALQGADDIVLLKNIFVLHYLENKGAAFGMLQGKLVLFVLLTAVVLVIVCKVYQDIPFEKRFLPLTIILIFLTAGAAGNLIDRVRNGYVVDFFYFVLIDFPVFNMADIYVSCSVTVLIILMLFYYKEDDFNRIFSKDQTKTPQ